MNFNKKFIIKYVISKEHKKIFLFMIPLAIVLFLFVIKFLYSLTKIEFLYFYRKLFVFSFLSFLLKIILFSLITFIIITTVIVLYCLISIKIDNVMAIINEQGLKLKFHNFIPWKYVDKIELFQPINSHTSTIQLALWIKVNKENIKDLSIGTKMGIFWSNITGYQHITFGDMYSSDKNFKILEFSNKSLRRVNNKSLI